MSLQETSAGVWGPVESFAGGFFKKINKRKFVLAFKKSTFSVSSPRFASLDPKEF